MLTILDHTNSHNQVNKKSFDLVRNENVKTVKDLVLEASNAHKYKSFARYPKGDTLEEMTFEQMGKICQSFSFWLNGQEKEDESRAIHVGMLGRNSINYLLIYISTIFSGNVTVPLDPNLYIDSLAYCVNHGDVDILFYDSEYQSQVNDLMGKCPKVKKYILMDQSSSMNINPEIECFDQILQENKDKTMIKAIDPHENALIIFTSGTTGHKKGVVLTHDNLINKTFSTLEGVYDKNEIYLIVSPFHHVFITSDFLIALRFGFLLTFNANIADLFDNLTLYQPTALRIVPLIVKNLLNQFTIEKRRHPEMSDEAVKTRVFGKNLNKIMSGGSYLSPDIIDSYHHIGIRVGQVYGATETSGECAITNYNLEKRASVGRIAPNTQVRIQEGEIQVKSPSVMKEYYKEPETTEESFTSDGWFRMGDLGSMDGDHYLYFSGRQKNLIILSNGENVAPEGIEKLFSDESLIQEMMVYGEDDTICALVHPNVDNKDDNNNNDNDAESKDVVVDEDEDDLKARIWRIIERKNKVLASYEKNCKAYPNGGTLRENPSQKIDS